MDVLKDIIQVLATTALLWAGRPPSQPLQSPTPTQPFEAIPTVTIYPPSRCLTLSSYSSMPGTSTANAQILSQLLVLFFGLSILGLFSLGLGFICLSLHGTQNSPRLHTSPPPEASPTVEGVIDGVAEARTKPEDDHRQTIQELSAKIENLEGQITAKAAEINSLESHHELELASIWSGLESQKSTWAAAQTALKFDGENIVADLRARIAQLEQQVDGHNATIEQVTTDHQTELETVRSKYHSALQTLNARHETKVTSLANNLTEAQALATQLQTDLDQALNENRILESSKAHLTDLESTQSTIISELKAQLEGQVTLNATEIKSLKLDHERQLASFQSDFEGQKSNWAAAQTALKVEGQTTVADLLARIARLEQEVDDQNAAAEQVTVGHHTEMETLRSKHNSNLKTLVEIHEDTTARLTSDLVEARALATQREADLDQALKDNQQLASSNARLSESSKSIVISKLGTRLEATSNQLKNANQEKAFAQDRLATAEAEVESIRTRLDAAVKEHTAVVHQKDGKITKDAETMNTLRSELAQQRNDWARFAPQMHSLNAEITKKDTEITRLTASLLAATSRLAELEGQDAPKTSAPAVPAAQPAAPFDNQDAPTEADVEDATSASGDSVSTAGSLTRSQSMTRLSPSSSPGSLRRRHSVNVIVESAKQVLEGVAVATATENLEGGVAAEEAPVEQATVQSAGPDSPEPSRNGTNKSETAEPSLPEQGLSASMWATSRPAVKDEQPPRPDWGAEAAARKARKGGKSRPNGAQRSSEQRRPRRDDHHQGDSMTWSTAERITSGRAGHIKTTRSGKDVRHLTKESEYKYHDDRR